VAPGSVTTPFSSASARPSSSVFHAMP
jgi:hypothetical protein